MNKNIDYNKILLDLISIRKKFKSYAGSEGVAYFVSDKYVLKEYTKIVEWDEFDKFFNLYCSEVQSFANRGLNVAKIYSWVKIPNIGFYTSGDKNKNSYFILEERVKGRELYTGYLEDAYALASDLCSVEEFESAIKNERFDDLYREIIKRYLSDYIEMNEFLDGLSDAELLRFLESAYSMYKDGVVSYPDLFPHNILVNDNQMRMIDMHIKSVDDVLDLNDLDSAFIRDVLSLFLYNSFPNMPEKYLKDRKFDYSEFESYSKKNRELTKRLIARFFAMSGSICGGAEMNRKDKSTSLDVLHMMFGREVLGVTKQIGIE